MVTLDLYETSSSDEEPDETRAINRAPNETSNVDGALNDDTSPGDGALNETSVADGAVNAFSAADQDEGPDQEKATEEDDGFEEDKEGPLSRLIDQAKYISQSLDNTLATLMKLKGNIQDVNEKIRKNQETSAKAVENLNKMKSDLSSFNSQIADFKGEMERDEEDFKGELERDGDRAYSVDKVTEGSKMQAEEPKTQAGEGPS